MAASAAGWANAARSVTLTEEVLRIVGTSEAMRSEDIEYLMDDYRRTSSCVAAKRGRVQDLMAATSSVQGARRADNRRAPAEEALARKGMGAVRKRLRPEAGKAKKEQDRQEAIWAEPQELLADARQRDALRR